MNIEQRLRKLESKVLNESVLSNVEKLMKISDGRRNYLGQVREAFGAKNEDDTSRDKRINAEDTETIIYTWLQWEIGDGSWYTTIKKLEKILN